jgi:hypothetical protein
MIKDRLEIWKVDNRFNHWVKTLPTLTIALKSTQHMVTHKTPSQVVFCDPFFIVLLLPTGERLTAQVMDVGRSIFDGDNVFMVTKQTEKSLDTVTTKSYDSIQQWLDGIQQASPTTNFQSRG